jgi:hypothetical protein
MRELLHSVVVVLHMWLFCWFGSTLTDQVSDFLECTFLFAPTDLPSFKVQFQCFQHLRLLSLFFFTNAFRERFVCMIGRFRPFIGHEARWGEYRYSSTLLLTSALEGGEGSASRPGRTLLPGKIRYPLYKRLGGPQGRSGQVQKISPPPGFDPRTVQPVGSSYTDYATRPTIRMYVFIYFLFNFAISN